MITMIMLCALSFDKQPISSLTALTKIDSLVLTKADNLIDSLNYKNLKRTKGAKGYYIEVLRTPL